MTTHRMKLGPVPFDLIGRGKKTIESRLFDEKRQQVAVGDEVVFEEMGHPEHTLRTRAAALLRYPSFAALFAAHDPALFGGASEEELLARIRDIYSEEDEKKYGVVGIRLELVGGIATLEQARQFLGKEVEVTMDRPMGSKHPKWGFEYTENYGYIAGVMAPDGEDLDAFFLGAGKPLEKAKGVCIAIAHRKNDDDDKLIVVAPGVSMTDEEIMNAIHFQEQYFDTEIVRYAPYIPGLSQNRSLNAPRSVGEAGNSGSLS